MIIVMNKDKYPILVHKYIYKTCNNKYNVKLQFYCRKRQFDAIIYIGVEYESFKLF